MGLNFINHLILAIVLIISLATSLSWTKSFRDDFTSDKAKTILQLSKSAEIKAFLNTKIDPCNDFYSFACGTWKYNNPAQLFGDFKTDKFDGLTQGLDFKLTNLLEQEKTENETLESKIIDFYQSCRNTKTDNIQYNLALENVYKEFGQFSFLKSEEQLTNMDFQWWSTVAKIQNKYGKSILLKVQVLDDVKDKSRTMLYLGSGDFTLNPTGKNILEALQEPKLIKSFKTFFGIEDAEAVKVAKELLEFEQSLFARANGVKYAKSLEEMLTLYNTTDLKDDYANLFEVDKFLEIVLGTPNIPDQLYVYDVAYLEQLLDIFNKTDQRIFENYILWQLFKEYIVEAQDFELNRVCLMKTKKYFGKFIDHVLYNQYRSVESEAEVFELWDYIKTQFRHDLQSEKYYWISNATREQAIEKLDNMNLTINSYDEDSFIEFLKNLDIDSTNYVVNLQNMFVKAEALTENKLEKQLEEFEDIQVSSYTPSYNLITNHIKIPIALLQPHFIWDAKYPKAIQFATLGYLIAHEMIHGFDDEGRHYDANGNARSWWDEKSTYEFESRHKCFQVQYHNYTYAGRRLAESLLQSENIADNAGLKLSYSAYMRWLAKQKDGASDVEASETLPRLPFNNRELFFISYAQILCEDTQSFFRSLFAFKDVHTPAKYRVIGSLSNFREFAWIWKCKKESPMDPSHKCEMY